ncbi:MAG: flagellar protein FlaG, partial [Alcanivorax sp.]|nr:flagellar protein FlaG [Alcanivorax sp.]
SEGRMVEREELVKPVQQINEVLRRYGVEFQLSEDSGRTIIRLIDRENGELIRQIPPEEALNAAQRLEEVKGRLFSLEV